jgi:hypothetical protein
MYLRQRNALKRTNSLIRIAVSILRREDAHDDLTAVADKLIELHEDINAIRHRVENEARKANK